MFLIYHVKTQAVIVLVVLRKHIYKQINIHIPMHVFVIIIAIKSSEEVHIIYLIRYYYEK
jgi:ribosomal protein L31E